MKQGTRVYMKSAPYRGVGTVIWLMGEQITVRWERVCTLRYAMGEESRQGARRLHAVGRAASGS